MNFIFRKNRISKKALIFNSIVLLVTFVALIWGYIIIQSKDKLTQEPIGQKQFDLFHVYQRGERALLFTDTAAKMATPQTIYDFGKNGGFGDKSDCGLYINSNLWQDKDKACYPDVATEYTKMFEKDLVKILVTYEDASFPVSDYSFSYDSSVNVIGISKVYISFPVTGAGVGYIPTAPFAMPKGAENVIKFIDEHYGQDIKNGIEGLNLGDKLDYGTGIGLISQESAADPYAISPTGCAGLAQVCYCTAWAYTPKDFLPHSSCGGTKQGTVIFDKVTPCGCTGKTDPSCKCNPSNDDRFDPKKSIKFIFVYLNEDLKHYSGYKAQLEFALTAYNTGPGIVDAAIKRTGKSKEEVTLDDMTSQISSDLIVKYIPYYADHPDLAARQVNDARNYAKKILAYKAKYNKIMNPSAVQQPSPPVAAFDLKSKIGPITGFVTFSSSSGINGAGAKGTYKIYPSFKVNPNYDFSVYNYIKNTGVGAMLQGCTNSEDAEACMKNIMAQIKASNSAVQYQFGNCGNYPEEVFYDFAEKVSDCANAKEDNCLCTFEMPQKTTDNPEDISISMTNGDNNIGLIYKDNDNQNNPQLSYTIPSKSIGIVDVVSGNPKYYDAIDSELKIEYAKTSIDSIELNNKINNFAYDSAGGKIYLFKKDGKIYFVDEDVVNNKNSAKLIGLKKSCEPDRAFRICATTNQEKYAYDPNDPNENKLDTRKIAVNFALNIPDTLPPALVQNIKVEEISKSENKVKVSWKKNVEKDVYKYRIYYSYEKDFVRTNEEGVHMIEVDSGINETILSNLEGYGNSKEKNTLHVVVIAVDYSGNEINDPGSDGNTDHINIDTLRPKMTDGSVTAAANGNEVKIKWAVPTENEDGSELKDLVGYRVYDGDTQIGPNIKDPTKTETTINNVASGEHTYYVEPVDESWKSAEPDAMKSASNTIIIS